MIERSEVNTAWWGAPVGACANPALVGRPAAERTALLSPFAWVELRADAAALPSPKELHDAGFFYADTQLAFRIDLRRVQLGADAAALTVRSFDELSVASPFSSFAPFAYERFAVLPGMSAERLARRYSRWAEQIAARHPRSALAVLSGGEVQGWFFAEPGSSELRLTLATLVEGARVSGALLYARALAAFHERGATFGSASFSVRNLPVLNIYASLGARFVGNTEHWFWLSPSLDAAREPS